MRWSKQTLLNRSIVLTLVILALNAVVTIASLANLLALVENDRWVVHTHEVLGELERTLSLLKDAETGLRGYDLTGDEGYLVPYREALPAIGPSLDRLASLTADNPRQQTSLADLRRAVADK